MLRLRAFLELSEIVPGDCRTILRGQVEPLHVIGDGVRRGLVEKNAPGEIIPFITCNAWLVRKGLGAKIVTAHQAVLGAFEAFWISPVVWPPPIVEVAFHCGAAGVLGDEIHAEVHDGPQIGLRHDLSINLQYTIPAVGSE